MTKHIVFISYSSKDKTEVEKLLPQLQALERSHNVEIWRDRDNIDKGADWEKKLNQAMDTAFIALLFVSPNFVNARYVFKKELPHFFHRESRGDLLIWPVFLGECAIEHYPVKYLDKNNQKSRRTIDKLQSYSRDCVLKLMPPAERDKIMADLVRDLVKKIPAKPTENTSPIITTPSPQQNGIQQDTPFTLTAHLNRTDDQLAVS